LALKGALEDLLGADEWYRLKDTRSVGTWRKSLLRALKVSEASIRGTVTVADEDWYSVAFEIIDEGSVRIKSSKTIVDLLSAFGSCYMRLSFHQLGLMPRRKGSRSKIKATPGSWDLSTYRSVQYVQTEKQRLRVDYSKDSRPISEKALDKKYRGLRR